MRHKYRLCRLLKVSVGAPAPALGISANYFLTFCLEPHHHLSFLPQCPPLLWGSKHGKQDSGNSGFKKFTLCALLCIVPAHPSLTPVQCIVYIYIQLQCIYMYISLAYMQLSISSQKCNEMKILLLVHRKQYSRDTHKILFGRTIAW